MTQFFKFYLPEFNPTGMSGTVGGGITIEELLPRKNALFAPREISDLTTSEQYRKLFIKQVYSAVLTGLTVELVNTEHSDQIYFGIATGSVDETISSPLIAPTGVALTGSTTNSVTYTGSGVVGTTIPIWLKQTISPGSSDDDFVAFQLRILATIV
jgi:hypothetical protein